jgi:membrane-associated phospholipid phosphatase
MPFLLLIAVSLAAGIGQALLASQGRLRLMASGAVGSPPETAVRHRSLESWLAACRHPTVAAALVLCAALVVSVAGWLLVGVLAFLVRALGALLAVDSSVARWGGNHATELSTRALETVTLLGDTRVIVGLAVLVLVAEALRGLTPRIAIFLVAVVVGNELITSVVKELMDRARPTLNPVAHTLGPSFPSGHSSTAAAFYAAAALILANRRGHLALRALTACAVGIAVAVAGSRVLLDVHWLSDVIAGLALGWAWVTFCVIVLGSGMLSFEWAAEGRRIRRPSPPR